jgi:hypothetical protein
MCKEFQRLKQEYERTLRVWAYYAFPVPGDVLQFPGRLEIGSHFGGKHHTTVMHSIAKIARLRRVDPTVDLIIDTLLRTLKR